MKKIIFSVLAFALTFATMLTACAVNEYILTEDTFFLVMTNMQYYPEQYVGKNIEYDCFTYELTDVDGNGYICGVRKCSAEYGCTCGNDTIIGFILNYDGELPEPKNQSTDSSEGKTWVHLKGTMNSAEKTTITIHSYDADGNVIDGVNEQILFLEFQVESCELIDGTNLAYYVTK